MDWNGPADAAGLGDPLQLGRPAGLSDDWGEGRTCRLT